MSSFRPFITASLALFGLATAGCLGPEETAGSLALFDDVPLKSSNVGGSSGTNSLLVTSFLAEEDSLLDITSRPLKKNFPAGTNAINSWSAYIVGTPEGREVLTYAARCALKAPDYVAAGSPSLLFPGGSILDTTTAWGTAALTKGQTEDLFACVITHLNPSGHEVDIYLKGPHITPDDSDGTVFDFVEAVWVATTTTSPLGKPMMQYHVWPQRDLMEKCGPSLEGSLGTRVCGTPAGCASLVVHNGEHLEEDCSGSDGSYTCFDKPAIETRLKTIDLQILYPDCI